MALQSLSHSKGGKGGLRNGVVRGRRRVGPRCSVAQGKGGISGNEMVRDGPVHQSACVLRALRTRLIWETCDPACVRVCVCVFVCSVRMRTVRLRCGRGCIQV